MLIADPLTGLSIELKTPFEVLSSLFFFLQKQKLWFMLNALCSELSIKQNGRSISPAVASIITM
jgi:hypothetical protein